MPGRRDRVTAMEMIQAERANIRAGKLVGTGPEHLEYWLGVAEEALAEAAREIAGLSEQIEAAARESAAYKGELAARDGRETILTFDRIGPEGVPTYHPVGTILACTDSDRSWRLSADREWVEVQ